jgi:hypothetical protein
MSHRAGSSSVISAPVSSVALRFGLVAGEDVWVAQCGGPALVFELRDGIDSRLAHSGAMSLSRRHGSVQPPSRPVKESYWPVGDAGDEAPPHLRGRARGNGIPPRNVALVAMAQEGLVVSGLGGPEAAGGAAVRTSAAGATLRAQEPKIFLRKPPSFSVFVTR